MARQGGRFRERAEQAGAKAVRSMSLLVAGSILLAAPNVNARAPQQNIPAPPTVEAPSEGRPPGSEMFGRGRILIEIGCPTDDMVETFGNEHVAVRENDCGMEIAYSGKENPVHFDSTRREQRGTIRDVLVGGQFSVILTENYVLVVPGRDSEVEALSSTDIRLPDDVKEYDFDQERNLFYFLSPEKIIYVMDVSGPEGGWHRGAPNERIGEDAKLMVFKGLLFVLQSGETPVIAFQDAWPGSNGWVEVDYPLEPALEGPISVEAEADAIVLAGENASLSVVVGTEGDAGSVSVRH